MLNRSTSRTRLRGLLAVGAIASLSALGLAGCSGTSSGGASDGTIGVALIVKTTTNPYFVAMEDAAKADAAKAGVKLTLAAGKKDGDAATQIQAIEDSISRGDKGILITPTDSTVNSAIAKARKAGLYVIALDTAPDPANTVDITFATDNFAAGEQQGAYVKAALNGTPPKLLMVDGTAGTSVDTARHTGFLKGIGLTDSSPEIKGHTAANGDQSLAQQGMENLLQRTTDINAVYSMNEPMGRGAYAALKARGLTGQVVMGSIDGGCEGVQNVKDGLFGATVMQFPKKMAEQGVLAAVEYAKTGKKPSGFVDTGSAVISDKPMPGVESHDTAWGLQNCWGGTK